MASRTKRSRTENSPSTSTENFPRTASENSADWKLFNDCVHGQFRLHPLCVKIIDTKIFQRLRHIKQLGFGYYVYPSAGHNRFEHSLGVCHLAGKLVDALNANRLQNEKFEITTEEKLCLQVAGLCHDLGHGPFSHVWEKFLKKEGVKWEHEDMSLRMFDEILKVQDVNEKFSKYLNNDHKQMIKDMIKGKKENNEKEFLYEIINNGKTGIDVDKWDYLLRDSKQLNIGILFDAERLMYCQRIIKVEGTYRICYRNKSIEDIWNMYMMRSELHRLAYQHQVVKIIEEMWIDALCHMKNNGYKFMGKSLVEVQNSPNIYVHLTDALFGDILRTEEQEYKEARKCLERILSRRLYSIIGKESLTTELTLDSIKKEVDKPENLGIYFFETKIDMYKLEKKVYVYEKSNLVEAEPFDNWSSVPIFPNPFRGSNTGSLNRKDVVFYCKSKISMKEMMKNIIEEARKNTT